MPVEDSIAQKNVSTRRATPDEETRFFVQFFMTRGIA